MDDQKLKDASLQAAKGLMEGFKEGIEKIRRGLNELETTIDELEKWLINLSPNHPDYLKHMFSQIYQMGATSMFIPGYRSNISDVTSNELEKCYLLADQIAKQAAEECLSNLEDDLRQYEEPVLYNMNIHDEVFKDMEPEINLTQMFLTTGLVLSILNSQNFIGMKFSGKPNEIYFKVKPPKS